jgi:hypothetical protein
MRCNEWSLLLRVRDCPRGKREGCRCWFWELKEVDDDHVMYRYMQALALDLIQCLECSELSLNALGSRA